MTQIAQQRGKQVATHLYGQEINSETYAIAKADLLLKGEGEAADNIVGRPEHSTLSNDAFPSREFDFMLSNPPYGKSYKSDLERMGGKAGIKDPRFLIQHDGDAEYSLITRSSDGQMLFLANMLSKMKHGTPLGSRIAEVHNGSSLFTGNAGQGESNIRRWIIEKDWLEALVALPLNMFYNTGIATYIWVLTNRKPAHRRGKVQLIDATQWFKPLRKNLGKKNCELSEEDITRICDTFLAFEETEQSKIFPNAAFGYRKVTVERPLRLTGTDPDRAYAAKEIKALKETAERDESAPPVIKKIHKRGVEPNPLVGLFEVTISGKPCVVEYEPDTDLRDTEQVPLLEQGGVEAFLRREVLPYAADAWYVADKVKIGYEISFTRYFYKPTPMRSLKEIRADILALEQETDGTVGGNHWGKCPMKATEVKFLDFLKKSPQFVIPIYQRTYSWTESECRQLWDDILRTGRDEDIAAHFVGSIVYIEEGLYQVSSQSVLLVIDGQQRLTTVMLILEALAKRVGNGEPVDGFSAEKLRSYYLLNPLEEGERGFKLLLTQTDKQSLLALMQQKPQPAEPSLRIMENFDFFEKRVQAVGADFAPLCKGLAKLMIVDIALSRDQDNPQLIFESMNSTGPRA